jgi:N utilization substance protein B
MKHAAHERARARRYALQALYQWALSGAPAGEVEAQFLENEDFSRADTRYFRQLLRGVTQDVESIDAGITGFIDRPLAQLDPVEHAILRIGICELRSRPDIPYRVTIHEAVSLAKKFGAEQGHAFVNGVLDRAARAIRPEEYARGDRLANGR